MALVLRLLHGTLPVLAAVLVAAPAARAQDTAVAPVDVPASAVGAVSQTGGTAIPAAAAAASNGGTAASAAQQAPANVTVQVIIDSPGATATAVQVNAASAVAASEPPPVPETPPVPGAATAAATAAPAAPTSAPPAP
ncbi:MAG: hypothetical protein JWQ20_3774, partial [Conexibacter sp.]|nr:hypothetical protein [Conexibacter sp.]